MGYESRLYIVQKTSSIGLKGNKKYAQIIATFHLGKMLELANEMRKQPITNSFVYADDGNTQILEDRYGNELTEATPQFVIEVLEKALNDGEVWWRIYPLLSMLKSVVEHSGNMNIAVLHYGY